MATKLDPTSLELIKRAKVIVTTAPTRTARAPDTAKSLGVTHCTSTMVSGPSGLFALRHCASKGPVLSSGFSSPGRACQHQEMATTQELIDALDIRLLEAINGKSTPDGVAKLAEARAWLTNPDQPHGGNSVVN